MLAAGSGTRFGGEKALESLGHQRVIDRSLESARAASDGVVAVVPASWPVSEQSLSADVVVVGGPTRSESVRAGLAAVPAGIDIVLVHDAARPLASVALFKAVAGALDDPQVDGAVPGLAVSDTMKRVDGARILETVARDGVVAVQTPQAFRTAVLRAAHATGEDATDDAALVEAAGGTVVVVPGERTNLKITHAEDLILVRALADRP